MKKKTVFIVDGDPASSKKLKLHFEALDFEVMSFTTGSEMMPFLQSTPSLILLAHDLKEQNTGLDYLRLIRELKRDVPVLFLLSQNDLDKAVHALRLGAAFYLEKINASFTSIKSILYDLDLDKKRKYWSALRTFRQGVFSLYGF